MDYAPQTDRRWGTRVPDTLRRGSSIARWIPDWWRSSTVWLLVASVIISCVLLWPLPLQMQRLTLDFGDVLLEAWTLRTVHNALVTPDSNFFGALSAYPLQSPLALYQPLYTEAVLSLPLYLAGWDPVAILNALLIFSFIGACWATALLARQLTGSSFAGLIAGMLYAFSQVRFAHLVHLNLLNGFWTPLILALLLRLWKPAQSQRQKVLILGALSFTVAAQALADVYNAVYMAVAIVLFLVYQLATRRWGLSWRATVGLCVSGLLALAICAVVLLPTLQVWKSLGLTRDVADHQRFSAHLTHYLATARSRFLGYDFSRFVSADATAGGAEQTLWPGLMTLGLAALGMVATRRAMRQAQGYFVCLAVVAFGLSLGPIIWLRDDVGGLASWPYQWLYDWAPLFSAARVPSRWALLAQLALAVLAAYGVAAIIRGVSRLRAAKPPALHIFIRAAVVGLVLADTWPAPLGGFEEVVLDEAPPIYQTLAELPAGPLLEWPMENGDPLLPHRYQYFTLIHDQPIVNAATSIVPARYAEIRAALAQFPDPGAIVLLRDMGVRYVNVNRWELSGWSAIQPRLAAATGIRLLVASDERNYLYEVLPDQPLQPQPYATIAPRADALELSLKLAAPVWFAPPASIYAQRAPATVTVRYSDGSSATLHENLPPVLLPGTHQLMLPGPRSDIVGLAIGEYQIPVSVARAP